MGWTGKDLYVNTIKILADITPGRKSSLPLTRLVKSGLKLHPVEMRLVIAPTSG